MSFGGETRVNSGIEKVTINPGIHQGIHTIQTEQIMNVLLYAYRGSIATVQATHTQTSASNFPNQQPRRTTYRSR